MKSLVVKQESMATYFLRQFLKEMFGQHRNPHILVRNALRHFAHVAFDFYHVVQNEIGQDFHCIHSDGRRRVRKPESHMTMRPYSTQ